MRNHLNRSLNFSGFECEKFQKRSRGNRNSNRVVLEMWWWLIIHSAFSVYRIFWIEVAFSSLYKNDAQYWSFKQVDRVYISLEILFCFDRICLWVHDANGNDNRLLTFASVWDHWEFRCWQICFNANNHCSCINHSLDLFISESKEEINISN